MPMLGDQQEIIYICSVCTQNVIWKTCQEWWMIGTDGERESQENLPWQQDLIIMKADWCWQEPKLCHPEINANGLKIKINIFVSSVFFLFHNTDQPISWKSPNQTPLSDAIRIRIRRTEHNGYHRKKWNWPAEFKSWIRLSTFSLSTNSLGERHQSISSFITYR